MIEEKASRNGRELEELWKREMSVSCGSGGTGEGLRLTEGCPGVIARCMNCLWCSECTPMRERHRCDRRGHRVGSSGRGILSSALANGLSLHPGLRTLLQPARWPRGNVRKLALRGKTVSIAIRTLWMNNKLTKGLQIQTVARAHRCENNAMLADLHDSAVADRRNGGQREAGARWVESGV